MMFDLPFYSHLFSRYEVTELIKLPRTSDQTFDLLPLSLFPSLSILLFCIFDISPDLCIHWSVAENSTPSYLHSEWTCLRESYILFFRME